MILILISLIAFTGLSIFATKYKCYNMTFVSDVIGPLAVVVGFFGLLAYSFLVFEYVGAGYKADILNKEYGTSYTKAEVFYASSVIDTVRELNRKRIEVNGNLMTGE